MHTVCGIRRVGGVYRARREAWSLMRLSLPFVVLVLLGLSSVAVAAPTVSGGVYIVTLPNGADVWVDGTYCGRSPVLVDALIEGRHVVTLTRTGWAVREAQIDVAGGGVAMWSTKLSLEATAGEEKGRGTVSVRGLLKGAKVSVDGAPAREIRAPLALPEGLHTIAFTGVHGMVMRAFTVLPDMNSALLLREQASPASLTSSMHVGVIVSATDYLPKEAISEQGKSLLIRYQGHEVVAHLDHPWMRVDGKVVSYNSAPATINGKLYLPLDLLDFITK
jgi:PEGA domain